MWVRVRSVLQTDFQQSTETGTGSPWLLEEFHQGCELSKGLKGDANSPGRILGGDGMERAF